MSRYNLTAATISAITACGFDVYAPESGLKNYLFYTDGTRIAYFQNDTLEGFTISTVHIPNKTTGTGYGLGPISSITREALEAGFLHSPYWVTRRDRESVRKYADMTQFLKARTFAPLSLCAKGVQA